MEYSIKVIGFGEYMHYCGCEVFLCGEYVGKCINCGWDLNGMSHYNFVSNKAYRITKKQFDDLVRLLF